MNFPAGSAHALRYDAYVSAISLQWRSITFAENRSGSGSSPPHAATRYMARTCAAKSVPDVATSFLGSGAGAGGSGGAAGAGGSALGPGAAGGVGAVGWALAAGAGLLAPTSA